MTDNCWLGDRDCRWSAASNGEKRTIVHRSQGICHRLTICLWWSPWSGWGSLLSKIGLAGGLPAISENPIRLTAAVILIWVWAMVRGQLVTTYQTAHQHPRAMAYVSIATVTGPVIGVWLALTSVQLAPLGIVTTLQSLPPIFLIPTGYFVFKERITWRVVLGTLVALIGSVLLCF